MSVVPPLTMMSSQVAVLVAAAERRLLDQLRSAGAYDPTTAVPLRVEDAMADRHLRTLVKASVVVEASPGRFYLDETALARRSRGSRRALAVLGTALLIVVVTGLLIWSF